MADNGENNDGEMNMWKALFEWSIAQGTSSGPMGQGQAHQSLSEDDKQWLEDALRNAMVDLSKQLVDIKESLDDATEETVEKRERLLDELLDLVESIDQAKDLSAIGGLQTLLHVMEGGVPSLQWRAAEVIATCAQNNPEVQASFFNGGVMPPVWSLLDSPDEMCCLKGLLAVSCLVRGSSQLHQYFSQHHGVTKMLALIRRSSENQRIVRKCIQILNYVAQNPTVGDREEIMQCSGDVERLLGQIIAGNQSDDEQHSRDVALAALDLSKSLASNKLFENVGTVFHLHPVPLS